MPIFERSRSGVTLTLAGDAFIHHQRLCDTGAET